MDDQFASHHLDEAAATPARGEMRDSMFLHASMRLPPEEEAIPLRVRNLSAGGLMADCAVPVTSDRYVEVNLRNIGAVPGRIAWVRENQIGVAFLSRIDPRLARKPVGTHAADGKLLPPVTYIERRPGLKVK